MTGGPFAVRTIAALVLGLALLAACRQSPSAPGSPGATPGSPPAAVAPPLSPTDPTLLRFHKVDLLISQWDVAQAGGRGEQADQLFQQVRSEVDAGFPEFLAAARGQRGLQLQYLGASALGFSTRPEATTVLVERLSDRDPKLVGNVLIALKLRADPTTPLPSVLQQVNSPAQEPRRYAPLALASILDARRRTRGGVDPATERQVASALSGVVADRDPYVRLHVAKALGALSGPGIYELLMILMKDEYVRIQLAAAAGLERLGDPRGFPEVVRLLDQAPDDTKPLVRDLLVSYGERLAGAPLAAGERESMGTSAMAWSRWWEDLRVRRGYPVDPALFAPGARPPPAATPAPAPAPPPSFPPAR